MNITEITPKKQQADTPIRLAAYCRVSSDSKDQLHSFAAQIKYYMDYAREHPEYTLVDIYADEGLTGTSMSKRDDLNRLMRDCRKGKIDRIIVKAVSRFARNTSELLQMLRMLKDCSVSVYFEEQGIDSDKMNSEMIVTFPGLAAQQESETISQNMRWSYKKRMESGEFNCCTPAYGFAMNGKEIIVNETEADIIRKIFDLYLKGYGKQKIANILNNSQTPCSNNGRWHVSTVDYILNNERYIGDARLQKWYTTESIPYCRYKNKGERAQYYVESANPPIISKEVFETVRSLQNKRQAALRDKSQQYVLSNYLRCPDCGRSFRRNVICGTPYWTCGGRSSGATSCLPRRIQEGAVYNSFATMICKLKTHREDLLKSLISQIKTMQEESSMASDEIIQIDKMIADLGAQNLVLARLHNSGLLNAAEYSARSSEISQKTTALRVERKKKLSNSEDSELLDELEELNEVLAEYAPNGEFDESIFGQIVESITVVDNTQLQFRLKGGIICLETIPEKERCKSA